MCFLGRFLQIVTVLLLGQSLVQGGDPSRVNFRCELVSSPQVAGVNVPVTITARDGGGIVLEDYSGQIDVSAAGDVGPIPVEPVSVQCANGRWQGSLRLLNPSKNVRLRLSASSGISSQSNSFTVDRPVRFLDLPVEDLIYDSASGYLYASVPNFAADRANTITVIDPQAGQILSSTPVGEIVRPSVSVQYRSGRLAMSQDGRYLYVAVENAMAVQRYDLATRMVGPRFAVGLDQFGRPLSVADLEVIPGSPGTVVIARADGSSARDVAIYDSGIRRIETTPDYSGAPINVIEPTDDSSLFLGYNSQNTGFHLSRIGVTLSGARILGQTGGLISGFWGDMTFAQGLLYASGGAVVDVAQNRLLGNIEQGSWITPEVSRGRIFRLAMNGNQSLIQACDLSSLRPLKVLSIPAAPYWRKRMISWGTDGLAFPTSDSRICLVQSSLLLPQDEPANLVVVETHLPARPLVGSDLRFSLCVSNAGPNHAFGVVLTNQMPTEYDFVSANVTSGQMVRSGAFLTWNVGALSNAASVTLELAVRPTAGGPMTNLATVTANQSDLVLANNSVETVLFPEKPLGLDQVNQLVLPTQDIAYEPYSGQLFCSIASGSLQNTIVAVDPSTGALNPIATVGGPGKLALSGDGQFLYAAADSGASIVKISTSLTVPIERYALGTDGYGHAQFVDDLVILPGHPDALAMSRYTVVSYSRMPVGLAIYDANQVRPSVASSPLDGQLIFGSTPGLLFAYQRSAGFLNVVRHENDATGARLVSSSSVEGLHFRGEIKADETRAYSGVGEVVDLATGVPVGKFDGMGVDLVGAVNTEGLVEVESAVGRVYFLAGSTGGWKLYAYDARTFALVGSMSISGIQGSPERLVRCGQDGFAFRTTGGQLFLLRSSFVPAALPADLEISVRDSTSDYRVGSSIVQTITIVNHGPNPASAVVWSNQIPASAQVTGVNSSSGTVESQETLVSGRIPRIPSGEAVLINVTFKLTGSGLYPSSVRVRSSAIDPVPANDYVAKFIWVRTADGSPGYGLLPFATKDILKDPKTSGLYVSLGSRAGECGNRVVLMDPVNGIVSPPLLTGVDPGRMAISSNGRFLYVALDGESAVQRLDLETGRPDLRFPLVRLYPVDDMAVDPRNPDNVVLRQRYVTGVRVVQSGIESPDALQDVNLFAFSDATGGLYACDGFHSDVPLYHARVGPGGLAMVDSQVAKPSSLLEMKFANGRLYYNRGMILEPESRLVLGTLPIPYNSLVEPDPLRRSVWALTSRGSSWTLQLFDAEQQVELGQQPVTGVSGTPTRLIRWGTDGVAFRTDTQMFISRVSLLPEGPAADLVVSGSVSSGCSFVGAPISYTLILSNQGPAVASQIVVTQSFSSFSVKRAAAGVAGDVVQFWPLGMTWQPADLAPGAAAWLTITATPAAAGMLTCRAEARYGGRDPDYADNLLLLNSNVGTVSSGRAVLLPLATRELIYDREADRIYASVPGSEGFIGNHLVAIDPLTGGITALSFAGSEPNQVALSDDLRFIYVATDGTMGARRIDLTGELPDLVFSWSAEDMLNAFDLKVQPGHPETIAVSRVSLRTSGDYPEDVVIYDRGVSRPTASSRYQSSKILQFSPDGSRLYGYVPTGMGYGFLQLNLGLSGIVEGVVHQEIRSEDDLQQDRGWLFSPSGLVIDPTIPAAVATNPSAGLVAPDLDVDRVFYLASIQRRWQIQAIEASSHRLVGTEDLPDLMGTPVNLIRCGGNRFAFRTTGNQVVIVHSTLVPGVAGSDLRLAWIGSPTDVLTGKPFGTSLVLSNAGPASATAVVIHGQIPADSRLIAITSSKGNLTVGVDSFTLELSAFPATDSVTVKLTILPFNTSDTPMTMVASVTALNPTDPDVANNVAALEVAALADFDTDGIADTYELAHGLSPYDPSDADRDSDGDGVSNRSEFLSGTDPRDSADLLALTDVEPHGTTVVLRFKSVIGRRYAVERCLALSTGVWTPEQTDIPGTGGTIEVTDPTGLNWDRIFYRVVIQP